MNDQGKIVYKSASDYTVDNAPKTDEISHVIAFPRESVKTLRETDFTLAAKEKICLRYDDCIIVLFYADNTESLNIAKIWAKAASQVSGPVFAACNLLTEVNVAKAFTELDKDSNHAFHWAGLKQIPFILVYRNGWPQAFYNGQRVAQSFIDYALTLACQADYQEKRQDFASMQADTNLEMSGINKYDKPRTDSSQYRGPDPIRGYNSKVGIRTVQDSELSPGALKMPGLVIPNQAITPSQISPTINRSNYPSVLNYQPSLGQKLSGYQPLYRDSSYEQDGQPIVNVVPPFGDDMPRTSVPSSAYQSIPNSPSSDSE